MGRLNWSKGGAGASGFSTIVPEDDDSLKKSRNFGTTASSFGGTAGARFGQASASAGPSRKAHKPGAAASTQRSLASSAPANAPVDDGRRYRSDAPASGVHPDGPYGAPSDTFGCYNNVANCAHMLTKLVRLSSGGVHSVDWQLNLRGGIGRRPEDGWRRHFQKTQTSFDATREICGPQNEAYQNSHVTPQDRRPDRSRGGVKVCGFRDVPLNPVREPGCEGSNVNLWSHILKDKRHGDKSRGDLIYATTLRDTPGDERGTRVSDNRNDGCIVEMLGKKRWHGGRARDPLGDHPSKGGDVRLHHLTFLKPESEPDEESRALRSARCARRDIPAVGTRDAPPGASHAGAASSA